ncbi:MAG: CsgE family curli-type amyloid fiber assembly protein [Bacteroidota bacterium]
MFRYGSFFLILLVSTTAASAQQADSLQVPRPLVLGYSEMMRELRMLQPRKNGPGDASGSQDGIVRTEIDGLVVDETQTKLGRDFYATFFAVWQAPEGAVNYTVVIQEQPMPNIGTRIHIRVNDELAFQTQLQPREEMIDNAARQGAFFTYRFVQGLASREAYVY